LRLRVPDAPEESAHRTGAVALDTTCDMRPPGSALVRAEGQVGRRAQESESIKYTSRNRCPDADRV
jgi:hypothetical protein